VVAMMRQRPREVVDPVAGDHDGRHELVHARAS
jgi:hypothetical protein